MDEEKKRSFFTTLPGILTGIAALLTAITGFYVATTGRHTSSADGGEFQALSQGTPATPRDTSRATASGTRITGRLIYDGKPVVALANKANAVIELMETETRRAVQADINYDPQTGVFEIRGVPPGKYTPFARLESGYPFGIESGGDFFSRLSGLNEDIVIAPNQESLVRDLQVVQVIHLLQPVDNQTTRNSAGDPPEVLHAGPYAPSADLFEWEPVPNAVRYEAIIILRERETNRQLDVKSFQVTSPSVRPQLVATPPNTYNMFSVNAYDAEGRLIGVFQNYYRNGTGGWFEFIVVPAPAP